MTSVLRWCIATLLLGGPVAGLAAPTVRPVDPRAAGLALASDGVGYLVVGSPCAVAGPGLCGTRVRGGGAIVEPAGFAIADATVEGAAVAFDGTSYLVAWTGPGGVELARVSPGGVVLDAPAVPLWPAGNTPSVASNGSGFQVVWEVFREPRWQEYPGRWADITGVYQAQVSPGGVVQASQLLSWAFADEHHAPQYFFPLVASDGVGYQVAMQSLGYGICDLTGVGRRVAYDLCLSPMADLASDGAGYFLVWDAFDLGVPEAAGVLGASLGSPGVLSVINATARVVQKPALTFDGQGYLAAWQDGALYASRLLTDGTVVDAGGVLLSGAGPFTDVHAASNGTTSLVTWSGGAALFTPAQPRHLRLRPDWSPLGGGGRARLTGQGLEAGATVTVGGLPAPDATLVGPGLMTFTIPAREVEVVDEGHATCTTPPGAGTVSVTVIGAAGQASTLEEAYLYEPRRPGRHGHGRGD